jgi:hypothetical protein
VEVVSVFFKLLYSQKKLFEACKIPSNKRKSFEVKSYYHVFSTPVSFPIPCKSIWKVGYIGLNRREYKTYHGKQILADYN